MTIYFRCKQSGNLVGFSNEDDIAIMRKEEHYEEVSQSTSEAKEQAAPALPDNQPKRRGRLKKEPAEETRSGDEKEVTI